MKQYFTGFFTALCLTTSLFLFMGSQRKNLGDIEVESIVLKGETGKTVILPGFIETYNADGKKTCYLGGGEGEVGIIKTYNADGKKTCYLGTGESGGGMIATSNEDGKETCYLGKGKGGDGLFTLSNNKGNIVVSMGALYNEKHNADGFINLFDRYGDFGWGQSGKQ